MPPSPALPSEPYPPYPEMPPPRGGRHRRAAIAVWVSASLLLLGSVCCVGLFAAMGLVPLHELRSAEGMEQVPAETWDEFERARPYLPVVAAVVGLFTVLPAAALLILGFPVARGRRGATMAAFILSIAALVVLGILMLVTLLGSVTSGGGNICGLIPILALVGGMVWCVVTLKAALAGAGFDPVAHSDPAHRHSGGQYSPDDDPWEHSL